MRECRNGGNLLSIEDLLGDYLAEIRAKRDLTEGSIKRHRRCALQFMEFFGGSGAICLQGSLDVTSVQAYVSGYAAAGHGHAANRNMFSTLRVLLGYLHQVGHLPCDLAAAVPSIQCRRLSHVPRGIDEQDIERLLGSIDCSEAVGKRDYAMVLLLSTYGVRGVQVRRLKLEDIRWNDDQIIFQPAKGGKRVIQHLTASAGNSLLDYLRNGRPKATGRAEVFLSCERRSPRPLSDPRELSAVIRRRLKSAGIELPEGVSYGSHSFRHAFAKRMISSSEPFKHVADMLGHKILNSTMIYTKIDLPRLRQAALEWPEVQS
jgi:site-specific recombinase XerD